MAGTVGELVTTGVTVAGSYTLYDIILDIARLLGGLRTGVATGGSTTTLVDTLRQEEAEYWLGGTLFIMSGTNTGKFTKIASYSSSTITFEDTFVGSVGAGVEYSVLPPEYPLDVIRGAVHAAMAENGDIISVDETLTTDTDAESYALPTNVENILRVEIAGSATSPYGYAINQYWKESGGYLYFIPSKKPGTSGYKIRLWYRARHPYVFNADDIINGSIDKDLLKWSSVVIILRNDLAVRGKDKGINIDLLNQASVREQEVRNRGAKRNLVLVAPDTRLNP